MKTILKALFLLIALSAVPVFAQSDFEATKARAEAGDATSQHNLGVMYENGTGVVQNDQEAVRWYRLAAEQGLTDGQVALGAMYSNGKGVAKDDQRAYVWFSIAATTLQSDQRILNSYSYAAQKAPERRDEARQLLSPQELEQAQAMATRCFESNYQDCD